MYPDNAEPLCVKGAPCSFKCKNGFTAFPDKHPVDCVCKAPHKVCNGVCGPFKACPSHKPWKRDIARAHGLCERGLTACGVWGRFGDAWECVNTATDLESCECRTFEPLGFRGVPRELIVRTIIYVN